jgi:hypothetical protein
MGAVRHDNFQQKGDAQVQTNSLAGVENRPTEFQR